MSQVIRCRTVETCQKPDLRLSVCFLIYALMENYLLPYLCKMGRMIHMAKCPKCGGEVVKPRKTWKMAGRPDRQGKRLELEIGLFDCPKCGAFRKALSKRKI